MTRTEVPVVRKQVVVNGPAEQALTAFTERFGDFKPPEHNLLAAAIAETVFEAHAGGHIYDRARGRQRVPVGPDPGLRATRPRGIQLGHQPAMAGRARPGADQRGRGPVHCGGTGPDPGRTGAPPPRPARSRLAVGQRRRRWRPGMAALPGPVRSPDRRPLT